MTRIFILLGVVAATGMAWTLQETIGPRGQSLVGIFCFLAIAASFSENLQKVHWRTVITGVAMQILLGVLIIKSPTIYRFFELMGAGIRKFLEFANEGSAMVFGPLAKPQLTGEVFGPANGFIFAVQALPTVIFVSAAFTLLYHLRVLQGIVWVFAKLMLLVFGKKGVSGAETLAATANVFMGQTEAPLIIKPYVASMTRSELLALMIGGMATVAGGVMAVYIGMGADAVAVLATSVMAAPCGLYLSKLLIPELEEPVTRGEIKIADERPHANVIDAAASGASDGMMLVLNIIAMLVAFIAGVALINYLLSLASMGVNQLLALGGVNFQMSTISLELIFSKVFSPVAFLTGVAPEDAPRAGELLGKKLVLNEFVAFRDLTEVHAVMQDGKMTSVKGMQERSYRIAIFALTGFANISSIGIQLGGIGAIAPERRSDLARLGLRALLGGFLATLINAAVAGLLLPI
jgi:CNT family concentrative nucleoside transporter